MNPTLASLESAYGRWWEFHKLCYGWAAIRRCGQTCHDPDHGSRHIYLTSALEDLEERLKTAERHTS
ncbi:hypothetical protein ACIBKY_48285 [Nonomuraea sp. NPDC050394]|uniref:hypothetical protein n=1 Tax=Nonomuraea sp. NPDC050394 TaxID=3364363 RepID=UPI00378E9625